MTKHLSIIDPNMQTTLEMDVPAFEPTVVATEGKKLYRVPTIRRSTAAAPAHVSAVSGERSSSESSLAPRPIHSDSSTSSSGESGYTLPKKKKKTEMDADHRSNKIIHYPKYLPSPFLSLSFSHYAYGITYETSQKLPTKPTIPQCRTNTNMANYVHKAYIYEQYVKTSRGYNSSLSSSDASLGSALY